MKIITPIEPDAGYFQRIPLLLSGLAFVLLISAVPSLTARLILLPGDHVREALLAQNSVTGNDLSVLSKTRERALIWRPMADVLDDLALAALTRAGNEKAESQEAQEAWREAFLWQRRALGRAPADTFGWARLAYMFMQTEGTTDATASALMRSLDTGPYEPSLMLIRLNMAVPMLDKLDADVRDSLSFMIRAAWEDDPEGLARTARENHFVKLVEKALMDEPQELADFRDKLAEMGEAQDDSAVQQNENGRGKSKETR